MLLRLFPFDNLLQSVIPDMLIPMPDQATVGKEAVGVTAQITSDRLRPK